MANYEYAEEEEQDDEDAHASLSIIRRIIDVTYKPTLTTHKPINQTNADVTSIRRQKRRRFEETHNLVQQPVVRQPQHLHQ